jgi:hypothetical protein
MTDLSLTTTSELVDELAKRVDAFLFIAYQDRSKQSYALITEFKGSALEVIGLSEMLKDRVKEVVADSREAGEE